jgi:hypothetical protein
MPHVRTSGLPGATASRGGRSPVLAEREASTTQIPEEEGVELRRMADGKGDGVLATRPFAAFDYAMRNFTIDHFPAMCMCGAARCRGSVTGWKYLPAARKVRTLFAPYRGIGAAQLRRGRSWAP